MKSYKFKTALVCLACLLAATVCPMPVHAEAATQKDETVYVNLASDGSVDTVYVVNAFELESEGAITDYGSYSSVKNLTTTDAINYEDGVYTISAPQGRFYSQGEMAQTEMPWKFGITYLLDGEAVDAQKLAGVSGEIEIRISVEQGDARYQSFYDNYVLQISYTLDAEHCLNVISEDANIVTAGKNISVGYTVMQAAEPVVYSLKASVSDFEMGAIQFKALHTGMINIDTSEYTGKLDEAQGDFDDLAEGVAELADAGGQLASASGKFYNGLGNFEDGMQDIADASAQISGAIGGLSTMLNTVSAGSADTLALAQTLLASDDPQVKALAAAYVAQSKALAGGAQGLSELYAQYGAFDTGLQSLPDNAGKMVSGYKKLNSATHKLSDALDELNEKVSGIPDEIQSLREKVDETIGKYTSEDFVPVSFISEKNNVSSVLFVMKTDKISISEPEAPKEIQAGPESFLDKLLYLFGLYNENE